MLSPEIAQSVVDHGVALGADFTEIFVEKSQRNTVSTLSNQVQSVQSGIDFGIGLRLVYGTKVLYGYTNSTEADELKRILSDLAAKDLRDPTVEARAFDYRHRPDRGCELVELPGGALEDR